MTKAECLESLDVHGDHLVHCRYGVQLIICHDYEVLLLDSDVRIGLRHTAIETRPHGNSKARRDIRVMGAQAVPIALISLL